MLIPSVMPFVHTKSVGGVLPMKLGRVGKGMLMMVDKFHSVGYLCVMTECRWCNLLHMIVLYECGHQG